jgi:ribose/xylose/arabinose/galactoside ABC-type transport system permease subunit
MVPADRRGLGLMMNWEVLSNITIGVLSRLSRLGFLNRNRSAELAQEYVDRLGIVTESLDKGVLYLSGGNQQKVLLARWLATKPRVLILDDPTRGIDVGAKREIYALIGRIAAEGVAVLITSSEMDEVRALSDRVLVMRNGRLIADLPQQACSKRVLMELVAGDPEKVRAMVEGCPDAVLSLSPRPATETAYENERVDGNKRKLRPSGGVKLNGGLGARAGRLVAAREFSVFLALCVVGLVFSVLTPHFLKASNLLLVSRQMVLLGIMTAGMTFVLGSGEVDLSVGWIFNMVMSSMAYLMANYGVNAWATLPVGLMISVLLGTVNGVIAVSMRLPTIIVTLGTMTLFRGMSLALNGGRTIANLPDSSFFLIGTESIGPMPVMTIIMIVVVAACAWLLRNTRIARHLLAMGSNSVAAARLGIQTNRLRVLVMAFNGLMCGIAGAIGLAFLGAADAQSGTGYDLSAIAAAIVGGAELGGGSGTVWGSLIGIGLIMVIQNGLVLLGLRPAWQIASTGLVIIAAVTIDHFIQERRARLREASRM